VRRAVLVYNPESGRRLSQRWLPAIVEILAGGGFAVEPRPTSAPGDATRLAREAVSGGVEVVFCLGGDGTLREVAAGLLGSEVILGPLPAGTANVMAIALGLPREARAAARVLPRCEPVAIDVGVAGGEPFLMCATGGIDAAVMARQDGSLKKLLGRGAIVAPTVGQLWRYAYPDLELLIDGHRRERVSYFAVCNIPYYAGAFRMAPAADFRDRRLDLVLFHGRGRLRTLGLMRDLALGRHHRRPDVEILRVEAVELVGPPDAPVQIDGDVVTGAPPLRIGLVSERLWILAPPSTRPSTGPSTG